MNKKLTKWLATTGLLALMLLAWAVAGQTAGLVDLMLATACGIGTLLHVETYMPARLKNIDLFLIGEENA